MENSTVREVNVVKETDTFVKVEIHGGNNGTPDWERYFNDLVKAVKDLEQQYNVNPSEFVVAEIKNDMLDDVYYATIYAYKRSGE